MLPLYHFPILYINVYSTGKGDQNSSGEYVLGKKLRQSPKIKVAKARSAVLEVRFISSNLYSVTRYCINSANLKFTKLNI